ncbi:MAG: YbhB/YbcL family Raf kinase inhibitor-like protein [Bacteroidetes bacterium]|nr:YbhB/YbcL family Raf kinase inhibitor-like protein [Bacteroidota bacterium]
MKKFKTWIWVATLFPWVFAFGFVSTLFAQDQKKTKTLKDLQVHSKVFKQNGLIPVLYTCDGSNFSPPLEWEGAPPHTKSFALICDDPDAPRGTFVHWVMFNIPASVSQLNEHFLVKDNPLKEILGGINGAGTKEYIGPCPPKGTHRYFFKVYALDITLIDKSGLSAENLMKAMDGHILAKGVLMGKYERK